MNENEIAESLARAFNVSDPDLFEELAEDSVSAETFREAGILSNDAGFVLRMKDGSEFQVTVVRSA